MVGNGDRRVADPGGEVFRQERADRPVDHADIVDEDGDDDDRDRIVDVTRLRHRSQPVIQRVVGDRRQQEAAQDHRLAADVVGRPAPENQRWRRDEQRGHHDVARGEHVHLGDLLQEEQRPELAAVPDHPFADHHDARDQDELDVGAEERLLPWVLGHQSLGLDLLEDRRLAQLQADVDGDRHQQEGHQERDAPRPCVEHLLAEVAAASEDHR